MDTFIRTNDSTCRVSAYPVATSTFQSLPMKKLRGAYGPTGYAIYDMLDPEYIIEAPITFLTKGMYGLVAGLVLYYLFKLWKAGRIDDYSIVVDSPLAVEATRIFAKNVSYFDDEAIDYLKKHGKLPEMPQLRLCESAEESKALNSDEGSKIILSASGMADAGRVLHHLKHNLWRPESTVLFVGYQAEGSLGRRLLDGAKQVKVMGEEISVKARIMNMDGFSAHADYTQIEEWLQHLTMNNAQQVFVVHGEATAAKAIKEMILEEFGWNAYIPYYADRAIMTKTSCEIKEANIPQVSVQKDMEDFFMDIDASYRQFRRRIINLVVKNPELMSEAIRTTEKGWRYVKRLFKDFGIS